MPVPFETLLPYAIMIGMFGISGTGLAVIKTWQNEGKRPRYSVDQWDKVSLMERDRRLTGSLRGQTDKAVAPIGFELNNPWKLEKRFA
ncbi:NADH dehydrogenase [ubiquinone] 1 alpha subcomplex subunit 1 [Fusarium sp. Ph1]|nr:NADH dehydrogenase [ubiquinone] 1 alpha subcomplex subunit 1 [Fusarium sp. Ph1]